MSFNNWSSIIRLLPFALAAFPAFSAERHSLILLVPKHLPSAAIDHGSAPALTKLRSEGVYFSNSHTTFPRLTVAEPDKTGMDAELRKLIAAASERYSAALVEDMPGALVSPIFDTKLRERSSNLDTIVDVLLPRFKEANRPFVLVYRFDVTPGELKEIARPIRSETGGSDEPALARAVMKAEEAVSAIDHTLRQLNLHDSTNVIAAAERGMSFIWKGSQATGWINLSAEQARWGTLPHGFLVMDLFLDLKRDNPGLSLFDPYNGFSLVNPRVGIYPIWGSGAIGYTPRQPRLRIESNGDHDLIYLAEELSARERKELAKGVVEAVWCQGYTSGVFVNVARVGRPRGSVSLEHLRLRTGGATQLPDIVVSFVSVSMQCDRPTLCSAAMADTAMGEGKVLRGGSFNRRDTWNFMAARGPDFQSGLNSEIPVSNADVVRTVWELLQLSPPSSSQESGGRILVESLRGNEGVKLRVRRRVIDSRATRDGMVTEVHLQRVGSETYFYAAGSPGWTVGIAPRPAPIEWKPWNWDWSWIRRVRISISDEDPEFEPFPPVFRDPLSGEKATP